MSLENRYEVTEVTIPINTKDVEAYMAIANNASV